MNEPQLTQDELVGVRGLLQERYEPLQDGPRIRYRLGPDEQNAEWTSPSGIVWIFERGGWQWRYADAQLPSWRSEGDELSEYACENYGPFSEVLAEPQYGLCACGHLLHFGNICLECGCKQATLHTHPFHDDTPNPTEPGLDDSELVAVRNLLTAADGTSFETLRRIVRWWLAKPLHERNDKLHCFCPICAPHLHDQSSADGSAQGPADGSAQGPADGPAGVDSPPQSPPAGRSRYDELGGGPW